PRQERDRRIGEGPRIPEPRTGRPPQAYDRGRDGEVTGGDAEGAGRPPGARLPPLEAGRRDGGAGGGGRPARDRGDRVRVVFHARLRGARPVPRVGGP